MFTYYSIIYYKAVKSKISLKSVWYLVKPKCESVDVTYYKKNYLKIIHILIFTYM